MRVDGLGRVRANDDIIARCRESERGDHNIVVGDVSPDWVGPVLSSPVTVRPAGPRLAIDSALNLDCDTGPGSQSRAEQLITGPAPGSCSHSPGSGRAGDCERHGARAARRGGALACKESAGPS